MLRHSWYTHQESAPMPGTTRVLVTASLSQIYQLPSLKRSSNAVRRITENPKLCSLCGTDARMPSICWRRAWSVLDSMTRCDPGREASVFLLLCIRPSSSVTSSFHTICVVWVLQLKTASWNNLSVRHSLRLFSPTARFVDFFGCVKP